MEQTFILLVKFNEWLVFKHVRELFRLKETSVKKSDR